MVGSLGKNHSATDTIVHCVSQYLTCFIFVSCFFSQRGSYLLSRCLLVRICCSSNYLILSYFCRIIWPFPLSLFTVFMGCRLMTRQNCTTQKNKRPNLFKNSVMPCVILLSYDLKPIFFWHKQNILISETTVMKHKRKDNLALIYRNISPAIKCDLLPLLRFFF